MKKCEICKEKKETNEFDSDSDTCINCLWKREEFYNRLDKQQLISMYKSALNDLEEKNHSFYLFLSGIIVAWLWVKHIENPNIFSDMSFWETTKVILERIVTAMGLCIISGIAWVILYIPYHFISQQIKSKKLKIISTVILILSLFIAYILYITM